MAKVYVSSTRLDLDPERAAVIAWLTQADHQPAHSYVAGTQTVRQGCLRDVCKCDAYVLILGYHYGHVPEDDNPDRLSITELEYRKAREAALPIVVLWAKGARDLSVTDYRQQANKVETFRSQVERDHQVFKFGDLAELIAGLSTGLQKELRSDPKLDPDMQREFGKLHLEAHEKKELLVTQSSAVLRPRCYEAVRRMLATGAQPTAGAQERAAAQALQVGDTKPAEALLLQGQEEAEHRARAAPDETAARIEWRRAAQLARERGAIAIVTDLAVALTAYEQATENEPDDSSAWTALGHLYIANGRWKDAERAFKRARQEEQRYADLPIPALKLFTALR